MRQEGSEQAGRWPWGVWLALVGVSAGTVASFAAVGWAFVSAELYGGTDSAGPQERTETRVVIEAEETPGPERAPGGTEPTTEALSAPVPEARPVEDRAEPAVPGPRAVEPMPERAGEASEEDRRLVPIEDERDCEPQEERPWLEFDGELSDGNAIPELVFEHGSP